MPLVPEDILDDIQARVDIADVIGRSIPLRRAGRHFKALCPFHKERTPSFHINTEKQIFHCFGCGVGGNVFSFLMQHDRLTFPEAVQQLAEQSGVQLPTAGSSSQQTGKRDALLTVLEKAAAYYERMLAHPQLGKPARAYLAQRGIEETARKAFRLGYAPPGERRLMDAAQKAGASRELLEQSGLILNGRQGFHDRFRERWIFPICDVRGRVVSFGGRSLAGQEPKYLNGPETPVYRKGEHLFGLAQAREAMARSRRAIVVEGYVDCVWLWQAGFQDVVSPLGTAFTREQVKRLGRFADRVILAFDPDAAGEAATLRGIEVLLESGLEITIARLPQGLDPDEFVRRHGAEALERVFSQASRVFDFLLGCALQQTDSGSAEGKVQTAQFMLRILANVPNVMLRAEYVKELSDRIGLSESAMTQELRKLLRRRLPSGQGGREAEAPNAPMAAPATPIRLQGPEALLAALVVEQPSRWDTVDDAIALEQFAESRLRRIVAAALALRERDGRDPSPAQLISSLRDDDSARIIPALVAMAQGEPSGDAALRACAARIAVEAHRRQQQQKLEQIRMAQALGHHEEAAQLLEEFQRLVRGPAIIKKE